MTEFNDWLRFQNYAKDNGFDSLKFLCMFPSGPKNCQWLDAYFGLITVNGTDGFITVNQLEELAPGAVCFVFDKDDEEDA